MVQNLVHVDNIFLLFRCRTQLQLPVLCRRASLSLPKPFPQANCLSQAIFYKITAWIVYRHDNPVITANVT